MTLWSASRIAAAGAMSAVLALAAVLLPGRGEPTARAAGDVAAPKADAKPAASPARVDLAELAGEDFSPGLPAVYTSLVDGSTIRRIDGRPAFTLGRGSPHPRLPPGPFSAVWEGVVLLPAGGDIVWEATVGGELTISIDDAVALQGAGRTDTAVIRSTEPLRKRGPARIRIEYRSFADVPARLQIRWEGKAFVREPLPAWRLKHVPAELSQPAKLDELAAAGRTAVGALGCNRCHASAFPAVSSPPPGPSLADLGRRVNETWLADWLADPAKVRAHANMPALFSNDRAGAVERRVLAEHLIRTTGGPVPKPAERAGDALKGDSPKADDRQGRLQYLSVGCVACHFVLETKREEQPGLGRVALAGLNDRFTVDQLGEFLTNPQSRYPDGRHPRIPLTPTTARDIAAYVLMWSAPAAAGGVDPNPPTKAERDALYKRLGARNSDAAGKALIRERRCGECHAGAGETRPSDVPIRAAAEPNAGCLSGKTSVRFALDEPTGKAIAAYGKVASVERHPSSFDARRQLIEHHGCLKCHSRDGEQRPPLEVAGSALGGAYLQFVPFLRTPRLNDAHGKYTREYLMRAVREGVHGDRHNRFSYRMPAFGPVAEAIVQSLAEQDGDLFDAPVPLPPPPTDPTLHTFGTSLVGFEGYSCVSCHLWAGRQLNEPDPGAIGPDLTTATRRIRRDWFDRWLDDPQRIHPGTAMPQVFFKGQPATLKNVLDADPVRQRDAVWAYLSLGKDAPGPKPLPPVPVTAPKPGQPPLAAQIPLQLSDKSIVESISVLYDGGDLIVYDVAAGKVRGVWVGAQILRNVRGRIRQFVLSGEPAAGIDIPPAARTAAAALKTELSKLEFVAYERLSDGVRIHSRATAAAPAGEVEIAETLRIAGRKLLREVRWTGAAAATTQTFDLPPQRPLPATTHPQLADPGRPEGPLERPGYKAVAYPRPRTVAGDDLIMPGAIAAHPHDGRVFVASMKLGELFTIVDPADDGKQARFEPYGGGLYQEAYSMIAESDGVYVLHRRNLTKVIDADGDGKAERFERVFGLPHSVADAYDYAYGLARDKTGAFVISYAPYASRTLPGSGGAIRLLPGKTPNVEEIAYGFRNPLGFCAGPDGEIFATDNQGEWVATNKLMHVAGGRFHGFPNTDQREHAKKPFAKPTAWVPYGWAQSINGLTYDNTGGKFGPFAGQIFLAELMYGGAIIRVSVEKVNGQYQGAAFPFWGRGLLGPLVMTFDPRGRMWVGSITEPGWMAQPDRGGVFRIDFTGKTPFEMQSIHARPRGFRLVFTKPVNAKTAADLASYAIEHHRYEYTGAYGSSELDRTRLRIEKVELSADGRSAELFTAPLIRDRVYMITAAGVRSADGESPVHPTGAYTLNEIPAEK